ncbi:MAG: hypothetical protein JST11_12180 [Acidobacteria bacterium]|nr:hypothetical protein [Acidobacteriota bacterium]
MQLSDVPVLTSSLDRFALICSLLGACVGGALGAYLSGRFQEKGRLAAVRAALAEVLQQERERAYEQERGKRLATHEDIDNVLRELGAVTTTAEKIKAEISNELWRRQFHLGKRIDAYVGLISSCAALRHVLVGLALATEDYDVATARVAATGDRSIMEDPHSRLTGAMDALTAFLPSFTQAVAAVHIFATGSVHEHLKMIEATPHIALSKGGARVREAIGQLDQGLLDFVAGVRAEVQA